MIAITPATPDDLQRLTALEKELFTTDRISRRQFRYLLTRANCLIVKAESGSSFLGYMVLLRRKNSRKLRLYSIAVATHARKQGVAGSMLGYAEQVATQRCNCNRISLEVCEENEAALRLYENAGYVACGRKEDYYEDGCTALLMQKRLLTESSR